MDEKGKGGEGRESKEAWGEEERTPPPETLYLVLRERGSLKPS